MLTNSIGMKLICFQPDGVAGAEYIGVTEVTQDQWEKVMGTNPSSQVNPTNPVEKVSWLDVQKFCALLSKQENAEYRLPTADEWKSAAKARGVSAAEIGSELRAFAWSLDDTGHGARVVGTKRPNGLGIYDMLGNVAEWCADKNVRGGSFLHSLAGCHVNAESPRHETFKSNDVGFRVVLVQQRKPSETEHRKASTPAESP